jgi:hypothetical protein
MSLQLERRKSTYGDVIFVALPRAAWKPIIGLQCACPECKLGAAPVWDTLVVPMKPPKDRADFATTCHYPEFSQPKPYRRELLPNEVAA